MSIWLSSTQYCLATGRYTGTESARRAERQPPSHRSSQSECDAAADQFEMRRRSIERAPPLLRRLLAATAWLPLLARHWLRDRSERRDVRE